MKPLGRQNLYTETVAADRRLDQLERRYDVEPTCCPIPTVTCEGSDFTANDGAYYGLAQLVGADPSAFGVADMITVWNDLADGSGFIYVKTSGASDPGVMQTYNGPTSGGFGDGPLLIAYDAGVVFDGPLTSGVAQLYLGQGVGGGPISDRIAYAEANMMSYLEPTLHLGGVVTTDFPAFDPDTLAISPRYSPILLVEGDDWDVLSTWFHWAVLSRLDNDTAVIFTP